MKETILLYLSAIRIAISKQTDELKAKYSAELDAYINAADGEEAKVSDELQTLIDTAIAEAKAFEEKVKATAETALNTLKEDNQHVEGWLQHIKDATADDLLHAWDHLRHFWDNVTYMFGQHPKRDDLYFTADNQTFYEFNDADAHAQALYRRDKTPQSRNVTKVTRDAMGVQTVSVDHEITDEDLQNNPDLKDAGVNAGDNVQISGVSEQPSSDPATGDDKALETDQPTDTNLNVDNTDTADADAANAAADAKAKNKK